MKLEMDSEFVIHSLRHTCASRLVIAGIDLYVVKEWLGHSSIQITERYAHLNPAKLVQAVEVLEE
jgi:site-specific recombinase XerD